MPNPDAHAIHRSDLNGFLFAAVGTEANGMTLSVLSTLARLGMDPWDEAGRLARQPKAAAIEGLARMIATLPSGPWPLADATPIAARLVTLLPTRGGGGGEAPSQAPAAQVAMGKSMLQRLALPGRGSGARAKTGKTGPSTLVLLLLAGILAGLTLYWIAQRNAAAPVQTITSQQPRQAEPAPVPRQRPVKAPDTAPGSLNRGA